MNIIFNDSLDMFVTLIDVIITHSYKSMSTVEQYLCMIIPLKFKTSLAKFRCLNTKLQMELGRQKYRYL